MNLKINSYFPCIFQTLSLILLISEDDFRNSGIRIELTLLCIFLNNKTLIIDLLLLGSKSDWRRNFPSSGISFFVQTAISIATIASPECQDLDAKQTNKSVGSQPSRWRERYHYSNNNRYICFFNYLVCFSRKQYPNEAKKNKNKPQDGFFFLSTHTCKTYEKSNALNSLLT